MNDGGAAFPVDKDYRPEWCGMTLRDYFAAKAMQGTFAACVNGSDATRAKEAYKTADAMLIQRSKAPSNE